MVQLLFFYFALVVIGLGLRIVTCKNPVHSVLLMLLLFFHMAGLYLLLNAEFLAAVQVIVYAGAILVLYLFVLFLVNLREELTMSPFVQKGKWAGLVAALALFLTFLRGVFNFTLGPHGQYTIEKVQQLTHTKAMGEAVYTTYILPFEIAGLILLVAVIGGLALAKKEDKGA